MAAVSNAQPRHASGARAGSRCGKPAARAGPARMARRPDGHIPGPIPAEPQSRPSMSCTPLRVLIAGGGVAALEAVLALRALAGERVRLELLAPGEDFVQRPSSVL